MRQRIDEQIVELPIPHIKSEIEVVKSVMSERGHQGIDRQMVELLIPHIMEDSVGEFKNAPQEHFRKGIVNRAWTSPFYTWTCNA